MKRKVFLLALTFIIVILLISNMISIESDVNSKLKTNNEEVLQKYLRDINSMTEEDVISLKELFTNKERPRFDKRTKDNVSIK